MDKICTVAALENYLQNRRITIQVLPEGCQQHE
jgi:hypothetical protein